MNPSIIVEKTHDLTSVSSGDSSFPVNTTCAYCGVGCGILAEPETTDDSQESRKLTIKGDPDHPANYGRLCVKGAALGETVGLEMRLLQPTINGKAASWAEVTDKIAFTLQQTIREYGPESVAFYVSGQLLTEDYYVVNKFAKGFIGTPHIDTNSRLCMSSAVTGHKKAFGSDTVPCCYDDLEQTDLITLVGSNMAWCHPVLFQRVKAAKEKNPALKVVVVDPRKTVTNEIADLFLPIRPGMDVLLFNYLLIQLKTLQALETSFVEQHTNQFTEALQSAIADVAQYESLPGGVSGQLGLSKADLEQWVQWFVDTPKAMTLFSMGVNQSSQGTDKVNAIINVHLATGRIGKIGAGPFSLTGQPNAMGGREVGGLATTLAAHMDIDNPIHHNLVKEFWQAPNLIHHHGYRAVDLFEAINEGKIKALWIMATNPVVSLPNANEVKEAIKKCPFVVVSEVMADTDCTQLADVLLPARGWGEKDGTVTNSERRISRQRAVLEAAGEAKPDWWAVAQVAKKMAFSGFDFMGPADIFREHAALSGYHNDPNGAIRDFNISGQKTLSNEEYEVLQPFQWPYTDVPTDSSRMFTNGQFYTANGKANFIPVTTFNSGERPSKDYPFVLNTGRIRDQWHTMTRTGLTARLTTHIPESFIEIHPADAKQLNLVSGQFAKLVSKWGIAVARCTITEQQQQGMVFMPIHWTGVNSTESRVGAVVNPVVDQYSGQPQSKYTPVQVEPLALNYQGFILARDLYPLLGSTDEGLTGRDFYASQVRIKTGVRQMFAANQPVIELLRAEISKKIPEKATMMEYSDAAMNDWRLAVFEDEVLTLLVWHSPEQNLPDIAFLDSMLGQKISSDERLFLLSGQPSDPSCNAGPTVCSCYSVGRNTIIRAIETDHLTTVKQVGVCTKAGTNCGSCQSEIAQILSECTNKSGKAERVSEDTPA